MRYPNGEIPDDALITFDSGVDDDGPWKHQLPPATYGRHLRLVELARARTGRTLRITPGWNANRPLRWQTIFRERYGNGAAVPRTSSHGGYWEGQDTAAIDYGNWEWVYENHGGRAAFYEDVRAAGMTPGLISTGRGYPDEPWHVVDPDPWTPVAGSGSGSSGTAKTTNEQQEDEDMKNTYMWFKRADGVNVNAIFNRISGYFEAFESNDGAYNTRIAQGADLAGPTYQVSESHFNAVRAACAAVRANKG